MEQNQSIELGQTSGCDNIAIGSFPVQRWLEPYDFPLILSIGTIFSDLHKPFYMGGDLNA